MWKTYFLPASLEEALQLLNEHQERARIAAGGTDLLLDLEKLPRPNVEALIDLSRIPELDNITLDEDGWIHLGPSVTHNQCVTTQLIREKAFALAQACWEVGAPQLRNRATIAGNLITASPSNDTITPLMALGAKVTLRSVNAQREIQLADFYTGVRQTLRRPNELITDIAVRAQKPDERSIFMKLGLRKAQAISVVNLAAVVKLETGVVREAAVTMGAVAPTIIHAQEAEAFLQNKALEPETIAVAAEKAAQAARPIDDLRGSAWYRREMVRILAKRALTALANGEERKNFPARPVILAANGRKSVAQPPVSSVCLKEGDQIETTINGRACSFPLKGGLTLLDMLRDQAGVTGPKEGCAEGECGACTVILDGAAVLACMIPAPHAYGKSIQTIEGLGKNGELHPLQKSFIKHGAVQCGACIPGMVMAGAALLEEEAHPDRDQVKQALSGNLCRCTGYHKIVDAVLDVGNVERSAVGEDESSEPAGVVGKRVERIDAAPKVSGQALYAGDMHLPNMLYGYTLRSPYAHARINAIDISKAESMPGVVAVLTWRDVPGTNHFGLFEKDQQVLAENEVRFAGEPVALVAVEDPTLAEKALEAIQVDYTPLPAVLNAQQALMDETPLVNERGRKIAAGRVRKGNIQLGFELSDVIVERYYSTQEIEHAYIETEAALTALEPSGGITVWSCMQHPHYIRSELAAILKMPHNQIRVIQTVTGGGFGGKIDVTLQHHTALLAMKTGRPVRMVNTREESIVSSYKRMPYYIWSKVGATRNGKLMAVKVEVLGDVGAYTSHGPALLNRGIAHCGGPYSIPHIEADGFYTFTHKVPIGAMRGYGTPAVFFAMEQQINRLATILKMDPLQLRHLNALRVGDSTTTGQRLNESVGLVDTIEAAAHAADWPWKPGRD